MTEEQTLNITQLILQIAIVTIPLMLGLGVAVLKPYLTQLADESFVKANGETVKTLSLFTRTLVQAAEQITGLVTNDQKKNYVMDGLLKMSADFGFPLSTQQAEALVEGILHEIKKEGAFIPGEFLTSETAVQ